MLFLSRDGDSTAVMSAENHFWHSAGIEWKKSEKRRDGKRKNENWIYRDINYFLLIGDRSTTVCHYFMLSRWLYYLIFILCKLSWWTFHASHLVTCVFTLKANWAEREKALSEVQISLNTSIAVCMTILCASLSKSDTHNGGGGSSSIVFMSVCWLNSIEFLYIWLLWMWFALFDWGE